MSVAETEVADVDADNSSVEGESCEEPIEASSHTNKRQSVQRSVLKISPGFELELQAFDVWRGAALNTARKGTAVTQATREGERKDVIRFITWLGEMGKLNNPTIAIFASAHIGTAAERYVKTLTERGRKYSYVARIASSFVAAGQFAATRRSGPDTGAVANLTALHDQARGAARQQDKFSVAEKPEAWLDWGAVQIARTHAEESLIATEDDAKKRKLTRDVTILRLLADQPPDRVSVTRTLQLGVTLKRKVDGSYELDLSQPGAHKTSAIFGPTKTKLSASVSHWLDTYIELFDIPSSGYLFHSKGDPMVVMPPPTWTYTVKSVFQKHGNVGLCPKDTRSSFITFLRSGEHDDQTVKAAAVAMRHSSKTAESSAYDKGSCDRRVSAAMKVASDFSAKFSAASSSGSAK